ncbi:hypothetical protein VTI74DRAFT_11055 [Chaetomium olivicolor]
MAHAWLDSLSEDWVSQPNSNDASFAVEATPSPDSKPKPKTPSRIPRFSPRAKKYQAAADGSNSDGSNVLGERSINERLAALSRRTPSKLSQELSLNGSGRDCHACRSASVSTTNSVVRKTIHRKPMSASQNKRRGEETPEWKRRLVYGDLSYGEQRDLFTSAGTGLENIFKPPQPTPDPTRDGEPEQEEESQLDLKLPSPPVHRADPSTIEMHVEGSGEEAQQSPKRTAQGMRYRRTDESADASKASDFSIPQGTCSHGASTTDQTALSDGALGDSRKVSGRSDLRNEDFSPILIERRQASNGKTMFGPAEVQPDELRKRLESVRRDQMLLAGDADDGLAEQHAGSGKFGTTEHYKLGSFVNVQRGGRSEEGSFRNHMLSSALNDSSQLNPEESLQASTPKQFPTVRVERWDSSGHLSLNSPDLPAAPDPSPEKRLAPPIVNGSPLKLFQPYDTFTSQTLLRRLSQVHSEAGDDYFSIAVDRTRQEIDTPSNVPSPHANRFGAGELDGYVFNDDFSHATHDATGLEGNKENREPEDSMLPPHSPIFDLTHDASPSEGVDLVVNRRRKSVTSRRSGRTSFPAYVDLLERNRDSSGPEIKRPRTSPSKDPTPKRRRTLHKSDVSYGTEDINSALDSVQLSHQQIQSLLRKSQQRTRSGDHDDLDPEEAAGRQPMRPRTPTPSQRSSVQRERPALAEIERSPARSSRHGHPPTAMAAASKPETHRKPSIKTEDFINEANKIMAMIRSKAGLPSGLASVEESDEDKGQLSPDLDGSFEESTQERFSRPPSREGRPPLTRISTKQEDPVLAEQLKKYEEASDMGDLVTSSLRSAKLAQEALSARSQESECWHTHRSGDSGSDHEVISDPPNIRISRNPNWEVHHQSADDLNDAVPSQGSARYGTHSTGMSFPTGSSRGSSRGSDPRKTIAPESVLHLIPDQVGDMVLDRQRNIWVKRKGSAESKGSFVQSEASSEDDPFADIPDLTVDVTKEMQNLMLTGKNELPPQMRMSNDAQVSPTRLSRVGSPPKMVDATPGSPTRRPRSSRSRTEEAVEHEITINEGRVREPRRLTISFSSPVASVIQDVAGLDDLASENGVLDQAPDQPVRGRRIVSIHATTRSRSARSRSTSRGPTRHLSVKGQSLLARPVSRIDERDEESNASQLQHQEAPPGMELSVLGDYSVVGPEVESRRQASLSFLVTPAPPRTCPAAGVDAAPIISQYVGTFSLSPLSEFTIHRTEETLPLEASYIVDNHRLVTGDPTKRVLSMSMRELVEKLAEVEPFEPYWEDMRDLKLREKGLSSLHALDEFCGQLESLDVSKNKIRNLGGIPSSVLHLRMTDNQLSSLTAWNHLMNLQYVDISNNSLTSLAAFKNLIHLRSLRVDNNQLTSLDDIKFHKGLQILRARGNAITELDFTSSSMHSLTDLDLKSNCITHITGLSSLPALTTLTLDANDLTTFSPDPAHPIQSLRYLRLNNNNLTSLKISALPHLRLLHADRNALCTVAGFSRARRIDSLSLREQHGPEPLNLPHLLSRAYEVRKLYLSGNLLEKFEPTVDLLNLQLLELANCGLQALPEHVGLMMPNLRVVNLNMNALKEVRALEGVGRLKKVFVAGNRICDLAGLVKTLGGWGCLSALDVRDNPVTQGFYAPAAVQRQVAVCKGEEEEEEEEERGAEPFMLPDQDRERDERYCGRLDMDTRVRRRLYETMVSSKCGRVKKLDGLGLKSGAVGVEGEGDAVWTAMAEKGLVKAKAAPAGEEKEVRERSGRWPAEDSFA